MTHENWQPVYNYEGLYEINRFGEVRSLHKINYKKLILQRIDRAGYYTVRLSKQGKDSTQYVHRLLGFTFVTNSQNKPCINHIDGNKLNNNLENLEWVTHQENMKHAYANHLSKIPENKCRKILDTCTGNTYNSISEACKALAIPYSTCKSYLNGNRNNPTCLKLVA